MHNIRYLVYEENTDRGKIINDIKRIAERDGEGYHSTLTWHEKVEPLMTEDDAGEFIKSKDNGWYDDHAVRFYDYSKTTTTKKIEDLEKKIEDLICAKEIYAKGHSVQSFKAKYIGCSHCGSKLNKEYFRKDRCPLCGEDLRSATTIEKLKWYDTKLKECRNKILMEKQKQKSKAKVMWLVKIEFHS